MPYVNYGGVVSESSEVAQALLDHASGLADRRKLGHILLRHRRQVFAGLPSRTHKVTMVRTLPSDKDALWLALHRKVRNHIRKGEKSELTVVSGREELLDELYTVFARNMRDLGSPVYGRSLFAEIIRQFPVDARLLSYPACRCTHRGGSQLQLWPRR